MNKCVQLASLDFYKWPKTNLREKLFTNQLISKFDKVVEEVSQILKRHGHGMVKND